MNKIVFFSSFVNETHVQFEASLLRVITALYPNYEYILVGNTYHINLVLDQLKGNIKIITVGTFSCNRKIVMLYSFWKILFIKKKLSVIHLTNYFPLSFATFLFLFANMDIIFMHAYWRDTQDRFLRAFYFFALYIFFIFKFKTKIFVLGEWIFNNIQKDKLFPRKLKKNYYWINHPYILNWQSLRERRYNTDILNFGFFSWKSSNYKNIENRDFINVRDFIIKKWAIATIKPDIFLSSEEYSSLFWSIDYVLFLSRNPAYQYRCSCILIEAIFYGKPIICFRSTVTSYLFNKYGNIGYIYDSTDDMLRGINEIIFTNNPYLYSMQKHNLSLAKKDFVDVNSFRTSLINLFHEN